jgi:hypothetical protein
MHEKTAGLAVHKAEISVPEAVRQILTQNYAIYQCLKMKLTNFHSVAEHILPEIVGLTGRKPSINTLVVAIKRFSDGLEEIKTPEAEKVLHGARIALSSGITDVTIKAKRPEFPRILKELTEITGELSEFPNILPLATSIKILLPTDEYDMVRSKLGHLDRVSTQPGMAKLSLYLSPNAEKVPGIASYVTELLYRTGVNIVDAFLGNGDIIMVLEGSDGHRAYEVLQREIRPPA